MHATVKICARMSLRTRRCFSAVSSNRGNMLDRMQRTIIGVTRDGGTVYKDHNVVSSASTTSKSSSTSTVASGHRVISVTDAIQARINSLRAPSGRLDNLYHGLRIPSRVAPWADDTRHTVEPHEFRNPQYMSDRTRHTTVNRAMSVNACGDLSIPHVADKQRRYASRRFNISTYRKFSRGQDIRANLREDISRELDMRRVAYKTACVADYHDRVGGKYCHVI